MKIYVSQKKGRGRITARKFKKFKRMGEKNRISSGVGGKMSPRRQKSRKEEGEFGPGRVNVLMCKKCGVVYWYKSWHHRLDDYPALKQSKRVKFVLCPACRMILDKKYEGEIFLERVPENFREAIKRLAKNFGRRAFELDPMDRIISIQERVVRRATNARKRGAVSRKEFEGVKDIRILTTENQLAKRLAKKINKIYGGKLSVSISHSHKEDVVRATINFEK